MDLLTTPRLRVNLDSCFNMTEVVDALALEPFITGEQPYVRESRVPRVKAGALLLPPDVTPARVVRLDAGNRALATGEGWTLVGVVYDDRSGYLTVSATTPALADEIVAAARTACAEVAESTGDVARVGFWNATKRDFVRRPRRIDVTPWDRIRRNYGKRPAATLETLMRLGPSELAGRLVLLHGPPGTGKTTALRALAHAWRSWCTLDYVLDPERMLDDAGYLMAVGLRDVGEDHEDDHDDDVAPHEDDVPASERWRLVVLEDCDELIGSDAKKASGQALGRLLNITDGMLGQGLRLLVAITTNEPLSRLHPAVTRPGRCLAEIEVGRLTPDEARAWLGTDRPIDAAGVTLADLYAMQDDAGPLRERGGDVAAGMYL